MQLGVSSYSFGRLVRGGALKQLDVIAKAREIGFDAIEFSTISVPEGKGLPEFAAEYFEKVLEYYFNQIGPIPIPIWAVNTQNKIN